jgi:hypothetical protein
LLSLPADLIKKASEPITVRRFKIRTGQRSIKSRLRKSTQRGYSFGKLTPGGNRILLFLLHLTR